MTSCVFMSTEGTCCLTARMALSMGILKLLYETGLTMNPSASTSYPRTAYCARLVTKMRGVRGS